MINRRFLSATAGYVNVAFVIAVVWHIVLLKTTYDQLGYFARKDPGFFLDFSTIFQGAVLAWLFPLLSKGKATLGKGIHFVLVMGIFFWSCLILATAAKRNISPLSAILAIESAYMAIPFTFSGLILGLAYRERSRSHG